jgi:hypothetical protein
LRARLLLEQCKRGCWILKVSKIDAGEILIDRALRVEESDPFLLGRGAGPEGFDDTDGPVQLLDRAIDFPASD